MAEKKSRPLTLLAISILALAASLAYFTFELSGFIRQVPDILENIRTTSEKVEPVLQEASRIRDLIPPILDEVSATREQIPAILEEVRNVRETIPPILTEVDKTREQLPALLEEVAAVREQLPSILASADNASAAAVLASGEMKAYRPIASEALVQVEGIRKEIPGILNRTEGLIDKARQAGKEASAGAVSGVISGIFTAPFRIVGDFGSSVLGLSKEEADDYSEEDLALFEERGKDLIVNGKLNETRSWKNPDTNRRGKLTLKKIYQENGRECRQLFLQSWLYSKLTIEKEINVCLNDRGEWAYQQSVPE